jgi:hypothetical protein
MLGALISIRSRARARDRPCRRGRRRSLGRMKIGYPSIPNYIRRFGCCRRGAERAIGVVPRGASHYWSCKRALDHRVHSPRSLLLRRPQTFIAYRADNQSTAGSLPSSWNHSSVIHHDSRRPKPSTIESDQSAWSRVIAQRLDRTNGRRPSRRKTGRIARGDRPDRPCLTRAQRHPTHPAVPAVTEPVIVTDEGDERRRP